MRKEGQASLDESKGRGDEEKDCKTCRRPEGKGSLVYISSFISHPQLV